MKYLKKEDVIPHSVLLNWLRTIDSSKTEDWIPIHALGIQFKNLKITSQRQTTTDSTIGIIINLSYDDKKPI